MLKSWAPRISEHTFQNADDFGTDVWFAGGIVEFERIKGNWVSSVGWVEVDDVLDTMFGNEAQVIDSEVAVRINNAVTLVIKYIT